MRIGVDAMGGDFAPGVVVEGVAQALVDFPDLDIVANGDTVEDAYLEAEAYLEASLEFASKMKSEIAHPSTYLDTEKMNPKRIVLLADAQVSDGLVLTEEEEAYKNFVQKYLYTSED